MQETIILKDLIKEPLQENLQTLFNHLGRYYYAMKKLDLNGNDVLLDVGCGEGYGSYLLNQYAIRGIFGLDIDNESLNIAKMNFKDILFLNINEGYTFKGVTKILCIEIIEHLEKNKIEKFIEKLNNFLMPNGSIYLTFPIGKNKPSEYNLYHKCEPSIEFIYNIVKKYFNKIEIEINNFQNNYGHYQDYCIMVAR